jgi:hypothetical protein
VSDFTLRLAWRNVGRDIDGTMFRTLSCMAGTSWLSKARFRASWKPSAADSAAWYRALCACGLWSASLTGLAMVLGCLIASVVAVRQLPFRSAGKRLEVSGKVDLSHEKFEISAAVSRCRRGPP